MSCSDIPFFKQMEEVLSNFSVRQILNMPRMETFSIPDNTYKVFYEDGVDLDVSNRVIVLNRYWWELFLLYPDTPIVSSVCGSNFMQRDGYNGDTHKQLAEAIFKHICEHNNLNSFQEKRSLIKTIYTVIDYMQNEILNMASEYVGTIDATDFVKVVNDPQIVEIHKNLKPTPEGMERAYKAIKNYVSTADKSNRFTRAYLSKAINDNQANQCIGPRGISTDLDRTVFRTPIMSGFIRGMSNLYELTAESCTAAKSLNANGSNIQTSEYTSRRVQLLTMPVVGVHYGDCGSQEYWNMVLTPQNIDNLKGIYYLKEDGNLDYIRGNETHLYQKLVKIRTAIGCQHHDPSHVCSTCLGRTSLNFSENSNLGYTCVAHLMEKLTQAILSTKHLTHSVKKSMILLEGDACKFFYTTESGDLFFKSDVDMTGLQLILPNAKVGKLVDVLNLQHTNIALSKIGELDMIVIKDNKHKTPLMNKVNISYKDRNCVITKAFLDHIKSIELESDSRGNFVISMDRFNKELPVFNNPLKETNIINFVNRIASIIETNKDKITDPYEKLDLLMTTVHEKFKCNLFILQVIIYATTAFNPQNNNYRLGRNSPVKACETKYNLFRHRSFSGLAVYQEQMEELISRPATTFVPGNREPHPMSVFIAPQFVVS